MKYDIIKKNVGKPDALLLLIFLLCSVTVLGQQTASQIEGFVFITGGTVSMTEDNAFQATVNDFYLAETEVTQADWLRVMGRTIEDQKNRHGFNDVLLTEVGNDYPVYYVSWYEAIEFCNRKSLQDGLEPVYRLYEDNLIYEFDNNGYRLPSETEWQYAATRNSPVYIARNNLARTAWYRDNSSLQAQPVAGKEAGNIGLFDMAGNVWEWCWDISATYPHGRIDNWLGPSAGYFRVKRGGSWSSVYLQCQPDYREFSHPNFVSSNTGFRLARNSE